MTAEELTKGPPQRAEKTMKEPTKVPRRAARVRVGRPAGNSKEKEY